MAQYFTVPVLQVSIEGVKTLGVLLNTSIMPIEGDSTREASQFIDLMLHLSDDKGIDMNKVRLN